MTEPKPDQIEQIEQIVSSVPLMIAAARRPRREQEHSALREYLQSRKETRIGRDNSFSSILEEPDFDGLYQAFTRLPITEYNDYRSYIAETEAGKADILGPGVPQALTLSGGTSQPGRHKLVPLFSNLQINHAGRAYCIARSREKVLSAQSYLNLVKPSVLSSLETSAGGFPIAMSSTFVESASPMSPLFSQAVEGIPFEHKLAVTDPGPGYWRLLLAHALGNARLRFFFSIYPNVVIEFLNCLRDQWQPILEIMRSERFTSPEGKTLELGTVAAERLELIHAALSSDAAFPTVLSRIWPELEFAVCVTTGGYSQYRSILKTQYGLDSHTLAYGASEGAIGYSLFDGTDLFRPEPSAFIEVARPGTNDSVPLSAAEHGVVYDVILTAKQSGFFRYRIGDLIKVFKDEEGVRFEVVGRAGVAISISHEMTLEHHLRTAIEKATEHSTLQRMATGLGFVGADLKNLRYVCFLEVSSPSDLSSNASEFAELFDVEMKGANDLYEYYRKQKLIQPPQVRLLAPGEHNAMFQEDARRLDSNQVKPNIVLKTNLLHALLDRTAQQGVGDRS